VPPACAPVQAALGPSGFAGRVHNPGMKRLHRGGLIALLGLGLLLAAGLLALQRWLGSDEVRQRIEAQAGAALGVKVQFERVEVTLWPLPGLALDGIRLQTRPALTVERVELRPAWFDLLQGRIALSTLVVRRAQLPQQGIDALQASLQKIRQREKRVESELPWFLLPRRTVLDHLTWVDARGKAVTLRAEARLDSALWPERLELQVLQGRLQGTRLDLRRSGDHAWEVALQVAGGTVQGRLELQPAATPGAEFVLTGQLQTTQVELSRLTAPEPTEASRAAQPLRGRLEASTTLSVRARQASALLDALQTQSKFTVQKAVLHGIDLVKAVQTVGVSRGGQTPLDTLAGQVTTRGKAIELQNLAASSGALSASGQVSVAPDRTLSGRVSVDLGGAVGVPLLVGGTTEAPEVALTAGAKIGAALGTVLMPGVGTGAGASVGGKIGEGLNKLFGK